MNNPAVTLESGYLSTPDDLKLRRRTWRPADKAQAIVVIVHGVMEHTGRWDELARQLAGAGFVVTGTDYRGHGESEGRRVAIDSIDTLSGDLNQLCATVLQELPDVPLFVLGHSLGSLVSLKYCLRYRPNLRGLVLSGNALAARDNLPAFALAILPTLARILPHVRLPPALHAEDISTDPAVVAAYERDPLVDRGRWRLQTTSAALKAALECRRHMREITVPLLVLHGESDKMISTSGARFAVENACSEDKTLGLYPNEFHEPLTGVQKQTVRKDLIDWLSDRTR